MENNLLEVNNLNIEFNTIEGQLYVVRDLSFNVKKGEILAIVGESGSGKTVMAKSIMRMLPDNALVNLESMKLDNVRLDLLSKKKMQKIRGKEISYIFQDPMTTLNPVMTIGDQIAEPMMIHYKLNKKEAINKSIDLLNSVGIDNPEKRIKHYPHQLSGGQRQRVVIAIALGCKPKLIIADEPTTSLDVTIQSQIINLLKKLQNETGVSIIFITHGLGVAANIADRVAVMYAGKIVEYGKTKEVFLNSQHPYTWGLLMSLPKAGDRSKLNIIPGSPPNLLELPKGDAFASRNKYALKIDYEKEPPFFKVSDTHYAATWLLHPDATQPELPLEILNRHNFFKKSQIDEE